MSLFTEGMTGYTENPKQSPKKKKPSTMSFARLQNTMSIYSIFKKEYFYTLMVNNWKFKNLKFP